MSKWDNIKRSIGEFADKTVKVTRELTDVAALKIKIANKEADRDACYKTLGKLAYIRLKKKEGHDSDELTRDISATLEKLDDFLQEITELKTELAFKKDTKEENSPSDQNAVPTDDQKAASSDTLNLAVMEEFKEARKEADEEYEKAKQAADAVK